MTDPTDPTAQATVTEEQNATLQAQAELADKAAHALNGFASIADSARGVFSNLQNKLGTLGISMKQNYELTQQQTQALGLLTTTLLSTRSAFDNLSGIDTTYLNTFTKQFNDLQEIMLKSPGSKVAVAGASALAEGLNKLGVPMDTIKKLASAGTSALLGFAGKFFESADNALRLQNVFVQLSAQTGNLQNVYDAAGESLDKMNLLLVQQQKAVTDTATATQLPIEAVEQYYAALGTIPDALQKTVQSGTNAGENVSMLTAAIQYATGSGRKYAEVIEDLKHAYEDYNLTGEPALRFTARMGELANNLNTPLQDVRKFLLGTADAFKRFGDESEGAAKMVNQYVGALKATGVSGTVALDMMNDLTGGIKNMGIAQKAFLSSQTGGAGGLQGAFQIEKLLREGKIDEVFDKVRQQMTKQFGQIVTLDEASKSPQAAAQLTKQMMILRQGPLGQFVKDDQSAIRMLEAFSKGKTGAPPDLSGKVVQDNMKHGVDLQQKSVTELTRIRSLLESTRGVAGIANLGTAQQALTAGVGTPMEGADAAAEFRDNLNEHMVRGAAESGRTTAGVATDLQTKILQDKTGEFAVQIADEYTKMFGELGNAIKAPKDKIQSFIKSGDVDDANKMAVQLADDIRQRKEAMNRAGTIPQFDYSDLTETTPGTLGTATSGVLGKTGKNTTDQASRITQGGGAKVPLTESGGHLGEITVHVEGYCLECGEKMKGTTQSTAVNVGQRAKKS